MMHNIGGLYDALNSHLLDINNQIRAVKADLEKQIAVLPYPDGVTVYDMKGSDGRYALSELLAAKAQILSGLASLKAADVQSRIKR